jgi:ProP effector
MPQLRHTVWEPSKLTMPVRLTASGSSRGSATHSYNPPERIALHMIPRNNTVMPGRSQNLVEKPVVILRKRTVRKSAVPPPAAKPSVPKTPPVATAPHATPTQVSLPVSSLPAAPVRTPAPKPLPPPEDSAMIAARRAERVAATQVVLKELMKRWPQMFAAHPLPVRPLATGIGRVIAAQLPTVSKTLIHHAIAFWQRQRKTAYLQALIAGGPRYDLEGNPQGEVTPEHQQRAQEKLVAWHAYRQEKQRTASQRSRPATARKGRDKGNSQDVPTGAD